MVKNHKIVLEHGDKPKVLCYTVCNRNQVNYEGMEDSYEQIRVTKNS